MRVLWIVLMLAGVVVFGVVSAVVWFTILSGTIPGVVGAAIAILAPLAAGACGAGVFMKPREFRQMTKPLGSEVKPAAWLDQLGNNQDTRP